MLDGRQVVTTEGDLVLETLRGKQFHAELVVEAIAEREGEAAVVVGVDLHVERGAEVAVVALRGDLGDTEAGVEVAFAVGERRRGGHERSGEGEGGNEQGTAHGTTPWCEMKREARGASYASSLNLITT